MRSIPGYWRWNAASCLPRDRSDAAPTALHKKCAAVRVDLLTYGAARLHQAKMAATMIIVTPELVHGPSSQISNGLGGRSRNRNAS